MQATRLTLRNFRNYEFADVGLPNGVSVVHGPVGAGKTNLLEAIYLCCTGRSCRTANDRELVRFGERTAHVTLATCHADIERRLEVGVEAGRTKAIRVDGVAVDRVSPEDRPLVCLFLPDRLELVKGPAAIRRSHLDSLVAALWPARRATKTAYARALAQRNALLGRVRARAAGPDQLRTWNRELARWGVELMSDRASGVGQLGRHFGVHLADLGMEREGSLTYKPRSSAEGAEQLEAELHERLGQDLERGFTTHGPHRDDLAFEVGGRDLRRFGSQGQQRLALLALLLAERDALAETAGRMPLMLLDDVLSELDQARRELLLEVLARGGQSLITTADPHAAWVAAEGLAGLRVVAGGVESGALEAA